MSRPYDWITFDCYGTLVDWEEGIGNAIVQAAEADGLRLDRQEVLAAYAKIEPIVQTGDFRSYREVLRETACRVADRFGWSIDETKAEFLPLSLGSWRPFSDTSPALARLTRGGYRLGILSNVDRDLLELTLRHIDAEFALVVTAQDVGAYKPDHAHFDAARERIGEAPWLHAAQSVFHDVTPALELGIPIAWINRKGEDRPTAGTPDRELATLSELADLLV